MVRREEQVVADIEGDRDQRERRFCSLYQEHYRSVQAYAIRRVESPADVADVVADVFTIAWRRLARIPEPPAERLWLYGVARRVIAGKLRSARRLRQLTTRLESSDTIARQPSAPAEDPVQERLAAALARLRPADREALALVLWEDLSHAEAAQVLECSVNAVAIRVHRAKARLRDALTASAPPGHSVRPATAGARPATAVAPATAAAEPNRS